MNNLMELYGEDVIEKIQFEIQRLNVNSNLPFDKFLLQTGIGFLKLKAEQTVKGEKEKTSLRSLVSESFGEATIYKYNIKGEN